MRESHTAIPPAPSRQMTGSEHEALLCLISSGMSLVCCVTSNWKPLRDYVSGLRLPAISKFAGLGDTRIARTYSSAEHASCIRY